MREEVLHALQDVLDVPHTKAVLSVKRECEVRPKEEHLISEIALPSCWSVFSSPAEMLAVNGFCVE